MKIHFLNVNFFLICIKIRKTIQTLNNRIDELTSKSVLTDNSNGGDTSKEENTDLKKKDEKEVLFKYI